MNYELVPLTVDMAIEFTKRDLAKEEKVLGHLIGHYQAINENPYTARDGTQVIARKKRGIEQIKTRISKLEKEKRESLTH